MFLFIFLFLIRGLKLIIKQGQNSIGIVSENITLIIFLNFVIWYNFNLLINNSLNPLFQKNLITKFMCIK
jgi:hypothetical protein